MILTNWPVYAMLGGALGAAVGLIGLVVGLVIKRSRFARPLAGLLLVSALAVVVSFNSSYWKKPDCYLPNGQLDETRTECEFS